jgi:hypothetical protein
MSIILRNTKGSPLTYSELDGNFTYLSESYAVINGDNTFTGNQSIIGDLIVYGTASFTSVTSSTAEISSSTFGVTINTPAIPRGIYDVYDTGLTNDTASLIWDSANDRWVYRKVAGSTTSAILLTGPKGTGGLGTEANIPQYRIPMSNGDQSLVSSNIFTSGSLNVITGSTFIYSFASQPVPTLGTGSGGFFLGGDNGLYGLYMGVMDTGATWFQSNRNDGLSQAYNILLQPVDGNVAIGKVNTFNSGPKLDISGSTLLTGSLGILGNTSIRGLLTVTNGITGSVLGTASFATQALNASTASLATTASFALASSVATTASFALTASFAANVPATASYALQALNASSASLATTASYVLNAVSSSFASTSSFINPLRQNVSITGSVRINNTSSASTAFIVTGRSGSMILDLNGTGDNYIDGSNLFIRNSAGTSTTALFTTASTSINSTTTNINSTLNVNGRANITNPTILSSSLYMRRADGNVLVNITSSTSSSISSSIINVPASFDGVISFLPGGDPNTTWDTDLEIYYSGVSGSEHTELSPVSVQTGDRNSYSNFNITLTGGITLISGSIPDNGYTLWIYASGSINKWFSKTNNNINVLTAEGLNIDLSGASTNIALTSDLTRLGFSEEVGFNPNTYSNTLTWNENILLNFTQSSFQVNSDSSFTGSLNVSGSTSFIGTHTLSGSNTITGNTVLSGSIIVSGSTTFRNTIFVVTGSQFYTGSSVYVGNQTITGSLSLQSNGIGTGLYINGQKQFNYISLHHTASIIPTQNVSGSFIYSTTGVASGISLVSGSRITFANTGIYNIQFSSQLYTPTNNTVVDIWFKKNGTNIANSATKIDFGNSDYGVAAWNFVNVFESGSYVEIAYQTDKTDTQFQYAAATGNIPAIPAIIATVTQVA